jgi:serine/threonine-protein kinase RsbW
MTRPPCPTKDARRSLSCCLVLRMVDCMDEQVISREKDPGKRLGTLRVRALLENVPLAIDCVAGWAQKVGLDKRTLYEIQLAVDEACANVADHAYSGQEPGDMEVSCYLEDQVLTIRVRDWGRGFDPKNVVVPDVDAPLEERTLGGLGLFIVRQVMDYVQFTVDPEVGNELRMAKRL